MDIDIRIVFQPLNSQTIESCIKLGNMHIHLSIHYYLLISSLTEDSVSSKELSRFSVFFSVDFK
jgi:hypothetical protein